ncbi:MAG: CDP-glucose 4,6-dehydratase [Pseudomonadota bacterium]
MESVVIDPSFWCGKSVLVTGHTGFKGGWLSCWLDQLGAKVHGYALEPPTSPSFFESTALSKILSTDARADLDDLQALKAVFQDSQPEIVFHLAAQPLVRASYTDPIKTFQDNVMGTAHVIEAIRSCQSVKSAVMITTDKVYQNNEWPYPYRETDRLGGYDPYSASKAAAELITSSFRSSFFSADGHHAKIATARAGNVIGGGDWATDRLVPDCLRAFSNNETVLLRNPNAVRPWQHVLDPLCGYLLLAHDLYDADTMSEGAYNFGPYTKSNESVGVVAERLADYWAGDASVRFEETPDAPHEAGQLRLDSSRAHEHLGWHPQWDINDALRQTVRWHKAWLDQSDMLAISIEQIKAFNASTGGQ